MIFALDLTVLMHPNDFEGDISTRGDWLIMMMSNYWLLFVDGSALLALTSNDCGRLLILVAVRWQKIFDFRDVPVFVS
jgi:hypothetical protein